MASMTSRLNGKTRRNAHQTIAASIHGGPERKTRGEEDRFVAEISARNARGELHKLLLEQREVDELLTNLAPASSIETRLEIAAASLHRLDDSQLLALICEVLHGREKQAGVLKP